MTKPGRSRLRWLRWGALACVLFVLIFAGVCLHTINNGRAASVYSQALGEDRAYRIYFEGSSHVIYALDGHMDRNAWMAASIYAIVSTLRGEDPPTFVAIDTLANRGIDFRNEESTPTYWRPKVFGRAPDFDQFLIEELIPHIEDDLKGEVQRTLSGFSLSGLYTLDLATRYPNIFSRIQAFSPTISHDTSITSRLALACRGDTELFASWGLESERDTKTFLDAMARWQMDEACHDSDLTIRRHFGVIHALIMMTGHAESAFVS